ncbi:MAG TPA: 6-pyruvoyl-tetrahydropterin synthase-related protein [Candidatus Saccharimonadales bacterium]|nr:6-pyruvoyl-tetrahydropterin synthase-related protein [Candidatus Saccharimonadales bacterium]
MKKKELLFILLLLVLSVPVLLPLTHHGFFQSDDGEWMIIRLSAFYQALHDGQFPVRFLQRLNFGYGYPVAEFLYPGSFYLGSLLHIIHFGFVNSIKGVIGISLVGSLIFTYFWLNKLFSKFASLIGALVALYLPYHLYDVYKRGSVGEVFALMWVPFILWQIERNSFFFTTIGIAFLIISHNTLAALFLPLIICYMAKKVYTSKKRKESSYYYIYILLSSLGLSAFFWLPIPFELSKTVFSSTSVSQWSNYFSTIEQIGLVSYAVLFAILFIFIFKKARPSKHRLTVIFFIISVVSIFMATFASSFVWNILPANFIQFPFRFLSVIVVTIPFLAAFAVSVFKGKWQWTMGIVLLLILAYSAWPFSKPVEYFDKGEGYYYTNDATTTVQDEYMPVWVKQKPLTSIPQKAIIVRGSGTITNVQPTNDKVEFVTDLKRPSMIQVNTIYWPGWHAFVDGDLVPISYSNPQGVMKIQVPKGSHTVTFDFGETPIRLIADVISLFSLICLIIIILKTKKKLSN